MSVKCYDNMSESHSQIREENNISLDSDDFHSGCRKSQSVTPTNMLFKQIVTRKIKYGTHERLKLNQNSSQNRAIFREYRLG